MELFLIHALGDAPSPRLIGLVSDHSTLGTGLGVTLITMVVAAGLLFLGAKTVAREDAPPEPGLLRDACIYGIGVCGYGLLRRGW
jgi:hypothetical protein